MSGGGERPGGKCPGGKSPVTIIKIYIFTHHIYMRSYSYAQESMLLHDQ